MLLNFYSVAGSTSKKVGAIGCYGLGTLDDSAAVNQCILVIGLHNMCVEKEILLPISFPK